MEPKISYELYNITDALAALRIDLSRETPIPDQGLVLSAAKARGACKAVANASASIERLAALLNEKVAGQLISRSVAADHFCEA